MAEPQHVGQDGGKTWDTPLAGDPPMRRTERQSAPGLRLQENGFGNKDRDGRGKSFGEMLLSGQPIACRANPHAKTQPRIRPRRKPVFGRRFVAVQDQAAPEALRTQGLGAVMFRIGLVLSVGVALLVAVAFFIFGSGMI